MRTSESALREVACAVGLLLLAATASHAQVSDLRVLFDLDDDPTTGCSVTTVDGPFAGVESVLLFSFDWSTETVTSAEEQQCLDSIASTFTSPAPVVEPQLPPWSIAPGQGLGGSTAVEAYAPASMLPGVLTGASIRIGVTSAAAGAADALGTVDGLPGGADIIVLLTTLPAVPTGGAASSVLLAVLMIGTVWMTRRKRPSAAVAIVGSLLAVVLVVGVAGAAGVLDGFVDDWLGVAPVGIDAIGDSDAGADIVSVNATGDPGSGTDIAGVCVRVDLRSASAGGFGVLRGDLGALPSELTSPSPSRFDTRVDFGTDPFDEPADVALLTADAQEVYAENGASGGSSLLSQVFSMDTLVRGEGAVLLGTESEIVYDVSGARVDMLISVDGVKLGVSVTRAFAFPMGTPISVAQAESLLQSKLDDLIESRMNVSAADAWTKGLLHVFTPSDGDRASLLTALATIAPVTLSDTIVIITVTDGADDPLY